MPATASTTTEIARSAGTFVDRHRQQAEARDEQRQRPQVARARRERRAHAGEHDPERKRELQTRIGCRGPCARFGSSAPSADGEPAREDPEREQHQEHAARAARTTGGRPPSRRAAARCRRPARRRRPPRRRAPTPRRGSSGRRPTRRTLAPSALNQASRPHAERQRGDEPRRDRSPRHGDDLADVEVASDSRRTARDRSSASSAITVSTAFSPVFRSVIVRRAGRACRARCGTGSCRRWRRS